MAVKTKTKVKQSHMVNGLVVWGVPKQVRLDFKAACTQKGTTMRIEIVKFMGSFTEKHG